MDEPKGVCFWHALLLFLTLLHVVKCNDVCDIHATIIRRVENEGFHRELHSLVEIVTSHSALWSSCKLALEETMPAGAYVNPDQLADMLRFQLVEACSVGLVDVEMPAHKSESHSVIVYSTPNRTENLLSASMSLPFHLRYHNPVSGGGHTAVQIGPPTLLLHCQSEMSCGQSSLVNASCEPCSQHLCTWINIPYKTNSPTIVLVVPVGNLSHYFLVALVTFLVTCGGCVFLLFTIAGVT